MSKFEFFSKQLISSIQIIILLETITYIKLYRVKVKNRKLL